MRMPSVTRWSALAVWGLVAACAAFWASRVLVQPAPLPPGTSTVPTVQALRGDVARLLGEAMAPDDEPAAPVAAVPSRFRLLGVVAPRSPKAADEGVALIVIDDRPARAFRVGATVDGALVLQRVHAGGADLGARDAAASVSLTVPPLPPPATGVPTARPTGVPAFQPPRPVPVTPRPLPMPARVQPMDPTGEDDGESMNGDGVGDDGGVEGEGAGVLPAPGSRPGVLVQ
jgi:general secretion pathway protein C